tara:strand:- start:836 stop:1027 length:192 start_codon:yes stop_codon:yes gene_type:complete
VKIGDLVRPKSTSIFTVWGDVLANDVAGLIVGYRGEEVFVYWNNKYGIEIEYREQLEVVSERG